MAVAVTLGTTRVLSLEYGVIQGGALYIRKCILNVNPHIGGIFVGRYIYNKIVHHRAVIHRSYN